MIRVDPGAQQTDAFQESRNLLLSPDAHADAIPGLEIEADDVRCTHAAAIAQIDRDQLFYLTARGLDPAEAKGLIIEGFLEALVERLPAGPRSARRSPPRSKSASPRSSSCARSRRRSLRSLSLLRVSEKSDDHDRRQVEEPEDVVAGVGERQHRCREY